MYALLVARNPDERAVLSLALQRAGLAVTAANELDRAMKTWFDRPADLILLAANPLDDIANASQRAGVMLGGRWYAEAEIQRRLEDMALFYGN